jgi:hypothetical protein
MCNSSSIKKSRRIKDIKIIISTMEERLQNIDYDDYDSMLIILIEIRDNIRIILKKTFFKRFKT